MILLPALPLATQIFFCNAPELSIHVRVCELPSEAMDLTEFDTSMGEADGAMSTIFYEEVNKSGRCGETLTATEFDVEKRLIEETGKIPTREEIHDKIRKTLLDWKPSTERTAWEVFVADEIITSTGRRPTIEQIHQFVNEKRHYPLIDELHVSTAHEEILNILKQNNAISQSPEFAAVRYTNLFPPVYWNTERCRHLRALHSIHEGIAEDANNQGIANDEVGKVKELVRMHNGEGDVYFVKEEYWLALKQDKLFTDHCVYSVTNHPLAHFILQCSEAKDFKCDRLLIPAYLTKEPSHLKCVKCGAFETVTCLKCKASKCRKCNEQGFCRLCAKGSLCFRCGGAWSCDECGELTCLNCLSSLEPHEIECVHCVWRIVFDLR